MVMKQNAVQAWRNPRTRGRCQRGILTKKGFKIWNAHGGFVMLYILHDLSKRAQMEFL